MTTSTAAAVTRPTLTGADGGSIAVTRPNLADVAEDRLRTLILGRVLVPGERIDVHEFAMTLRVSHTPLLTAIDRLLLEGLIGRRGRHNARFIGAESDAEQAHAALATLNTLSVQLEHVHRVHDAVEPEASLRLRDPMRPGDPFSWYQDKGRVVGGDSERMTAAARQAT